MSVFDFDTEISFDEYVNTITLHGETYRPKPKTVEGLVALATRLKSSIVTQCSNGAFDVAYYYCIEALQIFEPTKTAVPVRRTDPSVRPLLKWLIDTTERIKEKGLPHMYQQRIARVREREPHRQRILSQQMELDAEAESQYRYNLRRQQLLSTTTADESQLLNALGHSPSPTGGGGYGVDIGGVRTTTPSPPPSQYGSTFGHTNTSDWQAVHPLPSPPPVSSSGVAKGWRFPTPGGSGRPPTAHRGIVNLGNTCYMNSVLQVLSVTPLAAFFLSNEYVNDLVEKTGNYSKVVNAFSFVIRELHRASCAFAVSPSSLKTAVATVYEPFDNFKQQDANEFLRVILDAVHTGLNANASNRTAMPEIDNTAGTDDQLARMYWWQYAQKNASVVVDMCAFQERSMVTCPKCGQTSRSFFATLGIEVPVVSGQNVTLEKCLEQYCEEEVLDNNSLFHCPGCRQKVNARKRLQLYSAPQVLFITLKRFQHLGDFSNVAKVTSNVYFQPHLDVKPYMCSGSPSTKYELIGIVNHQGNMHGGHYTADASIDDVWFHASDEVVTEASAPSPSLAYILCYRRCS